VDRLKTSEAKLSAQAEVHKVEVEDLKKLAETSEKFEVAMVNVTPGFKGQSRVHLIITECIEINVTI
jgi:hypothetical protein